MFQQLYRLCTGIFLITFFVSSATLFGESPPEEEHPRLEKLHAFQRDAHPKEYRKRGSTHSMYEWACMAEKEFGDLFPNEQHRVAWQCFRESSLIQNEVERAPHIYDGTQVLDDLQILCGKKGNRDQYLGSTLNRTQSAYGVVSHALLYALPHTDITLLTERQDAIRSILNDESLYTTCRSLFEPIAEHQGEVLSIVTSDDISSMVHRHRKYNLFPFTILNKSRWGLLSREFREFALGAMGTGLGLWAAYKTLRYAGRAISSQLRSQPIAVDPPIAASASLAARAAHSVTAFTQADVTSVDQQRGHAGDYVLRWAWERTQSPLFRGTISLFSAYILFHRAYWWWDNTRASRVQDKMIYRGMFGLSQTFKSARKLYDVLSPRSEWRALSDCAPLFEFFDTKVKQDENLKELFELLQAWAFHKKYGHQFDPGVLLRCYLVFDECKESLYDLLAAIGRIDTYLSLATLSKEVAESDNALCFASYVKDKPTLNLHNMWNPFLSPDVAVPNDVILGGGQLKEHYIITGANAGGKSTFLKGVALSTLMAQTCGMVPAQSCTISPFTIFETYLNITDDLQQGNSLFEKEVMRAGELVRRSDDGRALLLFDEMFNGTTPYEGVSCAYSVMDHLVRNPRVISLVATHFEYLSSLADEHPNIANMKVVLEPLRAPGMWHRTYRLAPGVSDQHVALDMLAEKGLEPSIVSKAQEVLRKVEVSMRSSSPAPQNSVK